ncbi:MAG: hypothetical protein EA390_04795 [Balneolaceae bacterium]|nr:MAG: hypothetical protein EA390_04795 [Balneolaceae bacterium]
MTHRRAAVTGEDVWEIIECRNLSFVENFNCQIRLSPPFQGGDQGVVQIGQVHFSYFFEGRNSGPTTPSPSPNGRGRLFIRRKFY